MLCLVCGLKRDANSPVSSLSALWMLITVVCTLRSTLLITETFVYKLRSAGRPYCTPNKPMACRLGDGDTTSEAPRWSQDWQQRPGSGMLEAALEESEARASALDLENARLRLALVRGGLGVPDIGLYCWVARWRTRASGWRWCGE